MILCPSPAIVTVPCEALATITVKVSLSGSVSLSNTLITTNSSSAVVAISSSAIGGTLLNAQVKLVFILSPLPSLAVMVTL